MNLEKNVEKNLKKIANKKEKILVALSGGKDSAATAYLLKKLGYNIEGLYVDLCVGEYSKNCLKKIKELCENLDIKLHVYDLKKEQKKSMKDFWKQTKELNNCAACGIMKKWVLNKVARKLKVQKIATGHNLDDEAQTFLLNILKGNPQLSANTGPITKNTKNKKFIPRIKPLYYIAEKDVLSYAKKKKLPFLSGKCPHAEISYRIELRNFLENLPTKKKQNLMSNFEIISNKMQNKKNVKINYCKLCSEPSRGTICKKCMLLK